MSQTGYASHSGRVMDSSTGYSATHKLPESTIRSAYTILRAVLDTAVRDKALAQNPAHVVRRPEVACHGGRLLDTRSSALPAACGEAEPIRATVLSCW